MDFVFGIPCGASLSSRMLRESNDDILRLVILMTRVCDDFCDTLVTPCTPKSMKFVIQILYKYNKMFDEGKNITKTLLTYNFGSQRILKVHLKECDDEVLPKLEGTTLNINFKQATLLALIKLKQIIKLRNHQVKFLNTPRSVIYFVSYATDMMLFNICHPYDYSKILFDYIIGVCVSAYEDAHLIDGSCCHVAVLYILLNCKDINLRNQHLKDVIEKFESVGKSFDLYLFNMHAVELFKQIHSQYKNIYTQHVRMCDADNNICEQIEENDMLSLEEFRKYPLVVGSVKLFNHLRQLFCPFKELHEDFYGLVKLFEENVN